MQKASEGFDTNCAKYKFDKLLGLHLFLRGFLF